MTGTIKDLNRDKKFGFILGEDSKEYFFHQSALQNSAFDELKRGKHVTFNATTGPKGPRAEDVYI